jgi:UDP-N-acetylmuramoyl-L-alanyl-D-glutamate--2,6-diaminopimelate ligase
MLLYCNVDDKMVVMLQNTVANKRSYALKSYADYKAQILENQLSGLLLELKGMNLGKTNWNVQCL